MSGPANGLSSIERDFFVQRIIAGYHKVNINNVDFYIKSPTNSLLYDAHQLYFDTYDKCQRGISDEEISEIIKDKQLVSQEDEVEFNDVLPKHIEHWKKELYRNYFDKSAKDIRIYLSMAKENYHRIYQAKHQLDFLSRAGVAQLVKWQYLFLHSFYDMNWNQTTNFDWTEATTLFYDGMISDSIICELALSDEWLSIYNVSSKNLTMFAPLIKDTTIEQKKLLRLTEFYSSILSAENPPQTEILHDEDALDGWLLIRREELAQEEKNRKNQQKANKFGNANEIFIPASSGMSGTQQAMSVDEIYDMNNQSTKNIIKQRATVIKNKGIVSDLDFNDVQMDINQRMNNARR